MIYEIHSINKFQILNGNYGIVQNNLLGKTQNCEGNRERAREKAHCVGLF